MCYSWEVWFFYYWETWCFTVETEVWSPVQVGVLVGWRHLTFDYFTGVLIMSQGKQVMGIVYHLIFSLGEGHGITMSSAVISWTLKSKSSEASAVCVVFLCFEILFLLMICWWPCLECLMKGYLKCCGFACMCVCVCVCVCEHFIFKHWSVTSLYCLCFRINEAESVFFLVDKNCTNREKAVSS